MKRESKENTGEVNKEGGEGEGREGKSLEYSVYTFHQEPVITHIQRDLPMMAKMRVYVKWL